MVKTRAMVFKEKEGSSGVDYQINEMFQCPDEDDHSVTVKIKACGLSGNTKLKLLKELGLSAEKELPVGREISGIVTSIGTQVQRFSVGDEVAGVIPLSNRSAGCANFCVLSEFDLVSKPEKVSHVDAAGFIGDGVIAYTAIHYQAKLCGGETVLVFDGASSSGVIAIQLAQAWGAKVLATASTEEEVLLLESFQPQLTRVIDLRKSSDVSILDVCMMETGGLGIDCIIDNGVAQYSDEFIEHLTESELDQIIGHTPSIPSKHDIISSLAVGGRWVTQQADLQLDPPDSKLLYAKGACVSFLFEDVWTLSRGQQGRYIHILNDLMDKFTNSLVRPVIHHTVSLDDACKTMKKLKYNKVGKIVVTM